jgi:hypothetical protein
MSGPGKWMLGGEPPAPAEWKEPKPKAPKTDEPKATPAKKS